MPEGWATADDLQAFSPATAVKVLESQGRALSLNASTGVAAIGGADGSNSVYSVATQKVLQSAPGNGVAIHDVAVGNQGGKPFTIIGTANGEVAVISEGGDAVSFAAHSGPVAGLALHPTGDILASVGLDKSIVLRDLAGQREVSRIVTDSGKSNIPG